MNNMLNKIKAFNGDNVRHNRGDRLKIKQVDIIII